MTCLHLLETSLPLPERFNDPFCYQPHPLCLMAATEVQRYVGSQEAVRSDADRGKMFGVLVVRQGTRLGYLAAYSGLLAGRNDWPFFVPPVFDAQQPDGHFKLTERQISAISEQLASAGERAPELVERRKLLSEELQQWLFRQYRLLNARGETKDLIDIWQDYHTERVRRRFPLPPGGAGDCCAPKLLQYAFAHQLHPVAMAEFWWGASPRQEIRHHLHYYPACQGKCKPILAHMLQGLPVAVRPVGGDAIATTELVCDEEAFLVLRKPAGLLSVPGKTDAPSVLSLVQQRYPGATGPMIVHRLDMATSGLMVVAKTAEAYHHLQQQFLRREVHKRYVALLDRPATAVQAVAGRGRIELPLRPDPLDRPRQLADPAHGKPAITDYELLGGNRVALWPLTGRTHQLRVHCAHPDGLGAPIRGDELYGTPADRLYLHAEWLSFSHPVSGETLEFSWPAPF